MRLGFIAYIMILVFPSAFSQTESFFGNWVGKIDIYYKKILAVMFITKGDTGGYSIRLDFPEQGVEKIKISNCFLDKDSIYFDVKNARSKYYGLYEKKTIDSIQVIKMQLTEKSIRQQLISLLSPWYRYFLSIKPSVYVSKVKCPVLALNGDKDMQVTADENLAALNNAFRSSGNTACTVKRMNDLNHLFQTSVTGMPDEYAKTEETISPEVLDIISKWIKQQ